MDRLNRLAAMADAEFRGPAFNAWPGGARRAGKLRPGSGGGGGDGGARKMEQERQQRIDAAIASINNIFNGSPQFRGVGLAGGAYDPSKTYYTADGQVWQAPTMDLNSTTAERLKGWTDGTLNIWDGQSGRQTVLDQDAIGRALANGTLYTGVERVENGQTRQQMYDQQREAVTALNRRDADRQFVDAERQNRFGLARAGLVGGSADVDSNAELERRMNEGMMKAAGIGDQAAADLQTADERSRQNLISMAQSGIDTGTAQQMALSQLDANTSNAASARAGATVGSLFGDLTNAYLLNQQMAGTRAGAAPYANVWQPGMSGSTRTGYSGTTA